MDPQKVDLYLMNNAKFFPSSNVPFIRERMIAMDESKWGMIHSIELKDPTVSLIVSILVGTWGIDRFIIGDTGLGVAKLLTCGGLGIWTIVDWFLIMDLTRQKNMQKLNIYLDMYKY
ncbi:TM2 domain-containing protein [Flavobacterium sp. DG1-102-2]|uniref:TM2 domain-containing protein n=1 Tax=Flavobacterium sp. DG1-102-2 TaxID=3081663 RepID=UPI002948DD20|nr:TM2 domain-containing protein [Flavobacterium sp. DG1-102-2]MDV6168604.1 TM2 domain-containing protein [Flavobacterium sp. DG1-102-2]